jgi:ribose transport system permease protein
MTLGIGAMLTGGSMFIANGDYNGQPPADLRALAQLNGTTFGLPFPSIIAIVAVLGLGLWLFLAKSGAGRRLYATGVNPVAATFARVKTSMVWTLVFAASGALAGLAGVFIAAFGAGWSQAVGDPYLFAGLAAVLVGGTTFGSVHGGFTRTALGALILTVLSTLIVSRGLSEAQGRIVYGIIILAVVALYGRERHVRDRF